MLYHQLAVNLAGIIGQVAWIAEKGTGAMPEPFQLRKLPINRATLPTMPKHGKHEVSLANVQTIEIHKKKARD
jgi:hypothetical protein